MLMGRKKIYTVFPEHKRNVDIVNSPSKIYIGKDVFNESVMSVDYHRHELTGIEYVVSGSCVQSVNGEEHICVGGTACIMSSLDIHKFCSCEPGTVMFNLYFPDSLLIPELEKTISYDNLPRVVKFDSIDKQLVEYFLESLLNLYVKPAPVSNLELVFVKLWINQIVALIKKYTPSNNSQASVNRIKEILSYIKSNFQDITSMKQVADYFYLNPEYFSRYFTRNIGFSFNRYLNQLKVDYSKKLLLGSNYDINAISQMSGFSSINYYIKVFKDVTGKTPALFRKTHQ